ncbi:helix-turn-helix domain-containing protein [Streptosporangium saharense]|uniref:DNA-binding transcriptional MerR regulator n=1 Tax=Streptosporangium saharense TaxID=1706840 RepID=A0A7W7VN02_9ACTN|nr:MerR family transcriptional regulator [Streptosporangium saharense]MBB4915989.1 DNA-binding transcriptional MerR regulator [Streptosporangium saharense]
MEWTIGELAERASAALSPTAQLNGRVRDVPNERLIRWYATIGLLDPPTSRRGRVALYGRRHLLQLVAVKRRQAEGLTIAEIQAELAGASDQALETIADLPSPPPAPPAAKSESTRPRFWAKPPRTPHPTQVNGVRLAPGVTLMLDGGRPLSPAALADIGTAAEALLAVLREHDLVPDHEGNQS